MKKHLILGLLIPLLGLVACNPGEPGGEITSGIMPDVSLSENEVIVYFFASGATANKDNVLYSTTSVVGGKVTKPSKDPVNIDPAYNTFLGWSDKVIALSKEDLWDFKKDRVPDNLKKPEFRLYGQWDYVE